MKFLKLTVSLMLPLVVSTSLMAFPKAPFNALKVDISKSLDRSAYEFDFEGIVKLSNCSGSIIKFSGQPDTAPAYVLTNGHCLGGTMLKPNEVVVNRSLQRMMKVADKDKNFIYIKAVKLAYATMTHTDAAIYELDVTYADLIARDIRPFELDTQRPIVGLPIDIVSGYWERGYRCHIAASVFELREGGYVFLDSIRYSSEGCEVIGGTSGSPVVAQNTRTVVAINNTGNESGDRCSINNPCEVDDEGNINVIHKAGYGQQTYQFYSCLTPDFEIDLKLEGCALPKP